MNISQDLLTVFSGQIERKDGSYVLEVPEQELDFGALNEDDVYRVAVLPHIADADTASVENTEETDEFVQQPPVEEGERRTVEIETMGDQGDGIARVERGYVVIVPDTELDERVTVEIQDVQQNVAFAEVVKRHPHYE